MNKLLYGLLSLFLFTTLTSCGGGKNDKSEEKQAEGIVVKPSQVKVQGALADYFEVVDKEYRMKKDGSGYILAVQLKRNDTPTPYSANDIDYFPNADETSASQLGGFGIELFDQNHDVIDSHAPTSAAYSWDDMVAALRSKPGDVTSVKFSFSKMDGTPTSFVINSDLQPNKENTKTSAKSEEDENDLSESVENAKQMLNTAQKAVETEKELLDAVDKLTK